MSTVVARFVQTKHLALLSEPLVSKGRFLFKRPDSMLWEIEEPERFRIVIRGNEIDVPGLSPREAREAAPFLRQLQAVFSGDVSGLEDEFVIEAAELDGDVEIRLRPREDEMNVVMEEMKLRFARPRLLLRTIRLRNALGDALEIVLYEQEVDVPISTDEFAPEKRGG